MRIISGKYRRRNLLSPPAGATTRPMPDMVKEAVFNLLRGHWEDGPVIDLFSGTGTMGLEAISCGSPRAVFVERDRRVVDVLHQNIETLGVEDECDVVTGDALGPAALTRCPRPVHIALMDPPYEMVRDPKDWPRVKAQAERLVGLLDNTGYLVLRTPWPFLHQVAGEDESEPARQRSKQGLQKGSKVKEARPKGHVTIDLSAPDADDLLDEIETEFTGESPVAEPKFVEVPLDLIGAIGPETHAYGTTAVHLYMKDQAGTP